MRYTYQEIQPRPELAPYVECFWYEQAEGTAPGQYTPPHMCVPYGMCDLIVHLHDNKQFSFDGQDWQALPPLIMVGIRTRPVLTHFNGPGETFAIRFKPEALMPLFRLPLADIAHQWVDPALVFNADDRVLIDQIHAMRDVPSRVKASEEFLLDKLARRPLEPTYLSEAVQRIRQAEDEFNLSELSQDLYVSPRQLQRIFKDHLGFTPKTYHRLTRFRRVINCLHTSCASLNWSGISHACGYTDQSHLIREFREFTGLNPSEWRGPMAAV